MILGNRNIVTKPIPRTPGQRVDGWLCRTIGWCGNGQNALTNQSGMKMDNKTLLIIGAGIVALMVFK